MIKAAVLIIEDKGKVLFIKRSDHRKSLPGMWSLPAEKVVRDEPVEDAAERCAWHELGIKIKVSRIIDEYHYKDENEDKILYFVKCSLIEGRPSVEFTDEADELRWLSFKDFFGTFKDEEIGHGLRYLRKHNELLK